MRGDTYVLKFVQEEKDEQRGQDQLQVEVEGSTASARTVT